jgi:hypothetical protein
MGPGAYLYFVPASQRTPRTQFKTTAGQLGVPNRKLFAMRIIDEVHTVYVRCVGKPQS